MSTRLGLTRLIYFTLQLQQLHGSARKQHAYHSHATQVSLLPVDSVLGSACKQDKTCEYRLFSR